MKKYVCARPIHPGELLKEEVEYRGISLGELAVQMGVSYKALNGILREKLPLTEEYALLFENALGVSAGLFIRMQADYDLQTAKYERSPKKYPAQAQRELALA
jgi:addiction module HigA family antidote